MSGCYSSSVSPGETWSRTITWKDAADEPVPLTGYTATMTFKSGTTTVLTLTHTSGIALGGNAGTIIPTITAAQSAEFTPGTIDYDLWLTSGGGVVTKLLCGSLEVLED